MVTTPVPPTPVTMMLKVRSIAGIAGSGSGANAMPSVETVSGTAFFTFAPCTVTKDGQKPFTQEKSLLQFDWSICRLRPNSVSTGCTATQFDCTEQSPQASQTRSLMMTRLSGSGNSPRLRRRRFSDAQVWS